MTPAERDRALRIVQYDYDMEFGKALVQIRGGCAASFTIAINFFFDTSGNGTRTAATIGKAWYQQGQRGSGKHCILAIHGNGISNDLCTFLVGGLLFYTFLAFWRIGQAYRRSEPLAPPIHESEPLPGLGGSGR